jgi:hypothetical protein
MHAPHSPVTKALALVQWAGHLFGGRYKSLIVEAKRESDEQKAQRVVAEEMRRYGWIEQDLRRAAKPIWGRSSWRRAWGGRRRWRWEGLRLAFTWAPTGVLEQIPIPTLNGEMGVVNLLFDDRKGKRTAWAAQRLHVGGAEVKDQFDV